MRVLLLSSRFPWPTFTGDRLRAAIWLEALQEIADVTLVAPAGTPPADAPRMHVQPAKRSLRATIAGLLRVAGGAPVHALLAAPYDWSGAIARARAEAGGAFDAVIVLLSRLDPWVRPALPRGFRIFDAIDSLRRGMDERARESAAPLRWFWRMESRRVARAEAAAARAYDRVVVVSADESSELGAVAIPNGVVIRPLAAAPRAFDFGFWGRLPYFANADAVAWLLDEIWPAVRARRPEATLVVAGAGATPRIRAADGRDGVSVRSPVDDVAALARTIRIALFPGRYGTGQSNKVLEAAEAGCAIVATPQAMRGLETLARHAFLAGDAEGLARAAIEALDDDAKRDAAARALRDAVMTDHARAATAARMIALVRAGARAA